MGKASSARLAAAVFARIASRSPLARLNDTGSNSATVAQPRQFRCRRGNDLTIGVELQRSRFLGVAQQRLAFFDLPLDTPFDRKCAFHLFCGTMADITFVDVRRFVAFARKCAFAALGGCARQCSDFAFQTIAAALFERLLAFEFEPFT